MNKKIIAVALLILMISVVFISCGKREAGKGRYYSRSLRDNVH